MIEYERLHPNAWKIVLTLGEFLVLTKSELHEKLRLAEERNVSVIRFASYMMIGDDTADSDEAIDDEDNEQVEQEEVKQREEDGCVRDNLGDNHACCSGNNGNSPRKKKLSALSYARSLISQRSVYAIDPVFPREWLGVTKFSR
jgi:MoaA/NifB/PqqE/SkfB family radical SAM enzyme